jgi:hypothetical protein
MRRRNFLVGMGGICVGLPLLRKLAGPDVARASNHGSGPKRIIMVAYPMGTHVPMWRPSAVGSSFDLGTITEPVAPFVDRCLFLSNCPNEVLDLGGNGYVYGHPAKCESVFTGTLLQHSFGGDGANRIENVIASSPDGHMRTPNGPSVDHVIGQALMSPAHHRLSVDLGIWGPGGVRDYVPSEFFYEGASTPVTMTAHPGLAFASLFNGLDPEDGQPDETFLALQRRNKSVLDAVRDSFVDLRQGLDPADRRVLDEHAERIRQIELDMPPLASCSLPEGIPEADGAYADTTMMELAELQNRVLAHAMGCGVAPVGRIEYLSQQRPIFGIPSVDDAVASVQDWHHPIVHAADGWAEDAPARVEGFRFFVQKFADLLAMLDSMVEGPDGQTVLDNSLVVLGSDLAEGHGHAAHDLCFLVAGGSGPGRRGHHVDGSNYNVNHFLTSLLHMAEVTNEDGSPVQEFGLGGFAEGPIPDLFG